MINTLIYSGKFCVSVFESFSFEYIEKIEAILLAYFIRNNDSYQSLIVSKNTQT